MYALKIIGLLVIVLSLVYPLLALDTPEVAPGSCLYLVGAPPGEPAASEELRDGAAGLFEECANDAAGAEINEGGDNWIEAWIPTGQSGLPGSCRAFAWVSHAFRVANSSDERVSLSIRMLGRYVGTLDFPIFNVDDRIGVRLEVQIQELDPDTMTWSLVMREEILDRSIVRGYRRFESDFGQRLESVARPGFLYRVRLYLEAFEDVTTNVGGSTKEVIFGQPGSSVPGPSSTPHAAYDSIEVCLGEPEDHDEVLDAVAANAAAIAEVDAQAEANAGAIAQVDAKVEANAAAIAELKDLLEAHAREEAEERLEWELLNKDCRPGLWLPEALDGRLEQARALVARRLDATLASGSAGVNGKVAADRLDEADRLADEGRYQKACQRLSDALRALTTP